MSALVKFDLPKGEEKEEMPEERVVAPNILRDADPSDTGTMGMRRRLLGEESNDPDSEGPSVREKILLSQRRTLLNQLSRIRGMQ